MANTLATVASGELIVREALKTLLVQFPAINQVAHQYTDNLRFGQVANFHLVTATQADDYHTTNGYVARDQTQVDVPVTLNKHKHVTIKFNDQERSSSEVDLIARFSPVVMHALGKVLYDDLFALILNAAYSNKVTQAAASVDRTTLVDIGADLNGRNVPSTPRIAVLNSSAYAALFKDVSIISADFRSGSDAQSGRIAAPVHGFSVSEYSALPSNDENLIGFGANPEALLLATGVPDVPSEQSGGVIRNVTQSGLTVQMRQWYDWQKGFEYLTVTMFYGVDEGNTGNLTRLVSA
jgi:hypothetical protein